jgi:hypothetical protein
MDDLVGTGAEKNLLIKMNEFVCPFMQIFDDIENCM